MNRTALVISLVAMFLVGAALGLAGGILYSQQIHRGMRGGPGMFLHGGPRREMARDPLQHLTRLLDLTPEQVQKIEPLVKQARHEFEAGRDSLHSRIAAVLTPAQRARWQEFERNHPFPGPPRGDEDRTHRAPPGDEGERR